MKVMEYLKEKHLIGNKKGRTPGSTKLNGKKRRYYWTRKSMMVRMNKGTTFDEEE